MLKNWMDKMLNVCSDRYLELERDARHTEDCRVDRSALSPV